jgi:hypothetical protein
MTHLSFRRLPWRLSLWALAVVAVVAGGAGVYAIVTDMTDVANVHQPVAQHIDQDELNAIPDQFERFSEAFEVGDVLFATQFNALDGSGANVGNGQRFTRVPRADLRGNGQWRNHTPFRVTGPNAQGCFECHEQPFEDGSGTAAQNVHRDPFRTGVLGQFIERNTPHFFGSGGLQRLAEEMSDELDADLERVRAAACADGSRTFSTRLDAKGVDFGVLAARRSSPSSNPCAVTFNTEQVSGVNFAPPPDNPTGDPALFVAPFQWKGSVNFLRDFNRGAAHNELGMQSVEIVGNDVDGDFDGIRNEMTIGDQTALAVYIGSQPRPTTLLELNSLGLLDPALTSTQIATINRGRVVFDEVGCDSCHRFSLTINTPIFSEPSQNPAYRDGAAFPAGQSTAAEGVTPQNAVRMNLTTDHPDNHIPRPGGGTFNLGSFRRDSAGRAVVELLGDLKRHRMGPRLAEPVNEIAGDDVTPLPPDPRNRMFPDTFMTENLWGAGSTSPYMHDGRATTLAEAILEHAAPGDTVSEARGARSAYLQRSTSDKRALIAFLENQVLFKIEEEEAAAIAARPSARTLTSADGKQRVVKIAPKGFRIVLPE